MTTKSVWRKEVWQATLMEEAGLVRVIQLKKDGVDLSLDDSLVEGALISLLAQRGRFGGLFIDPSIKSLDEARALVEGREDFRFVEVNVIKFEFRASYIVPAIVDSDWDSAYSVSGYNDPDSDVSDTFYFNVGEDEGGGWYITTSVDSDTGHFADDVSIDDGPYDTQDDAILAGLDAGVDWLFTCGDAPRFMSASVYPEVQAAIDRGGMRNLFEGEIDDGDLEEETTNE